MEDLQFKSRRWQPTYNYYYASFTKYCLHYGCIHIYAIHATPLSFNLAVCITMSHVCEINWDSQMKNLASPKPTFSCSYDVLGGSWHSLWSCSFVSVKKRLMYENNALFWTKRAGIYRFDKFSTFNFLISIGSINLSLCLKNQALCYIQASCTLWIHRYDNRYDNIN